MTTAFYCNYELKDTTAIRDSAPSTTSNQDFAQLSRVKDGVSFPDYATLEEDYFLLDGGLEEFPDDPQGIVFFSRALSGADGAFTEPPSFTVSFTEHHSSCGLTFHFVGDAPLELEITWYDLSGVPLSRQVFLVTGRDYFAENQVENYGKLRVVFLRAKPYRYVKFNFLEYGRDLVFGSGGLPVKEAKLVEETDPTGDKIAVNKLTYQVIDETDTFNIGNRAGLHKALQPGQPLTAWEKLDGKKVLLGKFFLDSASTEGNVTSMSCVDYKGLLDRNRFLGGRVYNGEPAGPVIDAVMEAAGITDYTVDEETRNTPLHGWLKIQTCRKALREIMFACGAAVDTSRSLTLNIFQPDRTIQSTVRRSRKFSTQAAEEEYISDVSVKFPVYTLQEEEKEVVKGTYETAGNYTVELSSPARDMTINTGVILEKSDNYVTFSLDGPADVVVLGKKFGKEDLTVTASVEKVQAGRTRKSKSFTGTLLNHSGAAALAGKLLEYYGLRLFLKVKFLNQGEAPADWAEICNTRRDYGSYVAGMGKLTTDLTGGFVSTGELRGYYKLLAKYDYTGEISAGDEMGEL